MKCHSCGRPIVPSSGQCSFCGAQSGDAGDDAEPTKPEPAVLVTDGGNGPDDDPLEPTDEEDEEYLDPEDIVEDDLDEGQQEASGEPGSGGEPPSGGPERNGQPPGNQSDGQSQGGQPRGGEPQGSEPQGEQPQEEQPQGEQPQGGQPQGGQPRGSEPQGGQPQGGQPRGSEPQGGQPQGGQPQGGQPRGSEPQGGQPQGGQPQGGPDSGSQSGRLKQGSQPGTYPDQGGQSTAQRTGQTEESGGELVDQLKEFPLKLGAALGALAFFVPYLLITLASYWAYEEDPIVGDTNMNAFDVGAEVFMTVAGFGSGDRIVDLYIGMADVDVTSPGEVDPSNYPTVEDQLGPLLSLLDSYPEVPLLILYILAPYILFMSGRYLARHYAPSDALADRVVAGLTVVLGTFPLILIVGAVFQVFVLLERLILVGLLIPAIIGALSGASIWLFDRQSALVSSLVGWITIGVSIAAAFVILPLPALNLGDDASLALSFLDRLVVGVGTYLNILEFNMGAHNMGRLYFILVVLITIAAGFIRTWRVADIENRMQGAIAGSSIWLGYFSTIALLLWVFPMSTIFVNVAMEGATNIISGSDLTLAIQPEAIENGAGASIPTLESVINVDSYLHSIIVAGFVFPAIFGGIGGYIATWLTER